MKHQHLFHRAIGRFIHGLKQPGQLNVILSPECGGYQNIPLFCSEDRGNDTEYCNVDILVTVGGDVRLIVEIEESDLSPTRICGKFLTSALTKYLIHDRVAKAPITMADHVTFIQVLNTCGLNERSQKPEQTSNIQKSILAVLPVKGSPIDAYRLFCFKGEIDFETDTTQRTDFKRCVTNSLS